MYGVLIGAGTTSIGIVLGALLERWRDDIRWKREEDTRWTSDLRVLYRDLLASADEFFRRLRHTRMLESRMKADAPPISESEGDRLVGLLTDSLDVMQREYQNVNAIAAEFELIGSKDESEAVALLAIQVVAATVLPSDGSLRDAEEGYAKAKRAVIEVARQSLRRV